MNANYSHPVAGASVNPRANSALRTFAIVACAGLILFFALWNLTHFPRTWYDEGSHLHVPKTFVTHGVYADLSSEGYRHYGPTIGVGPTVLLPIAGAFQAFGIGLLQARLVMVIYLLATIVVFFQLAKVLGGAKLAWAATAIFVTSQSISLFEYGRQVLGEVPGLFFILAGLLLWFTGWSKSGWLRLAAVGLLLGLGVVTKYQYLLVVAPALLLAWGLNLVYFRGAPQRVFLVPGIVTATVFGLWQLFTLVYLGPSTISENFASLREFTAGAAAVFSRELMMRSLREIISFRAFFFLLIPALAYGAYVAFARPKRTANAQVAVAESRQTQQQWNIIFLLVVLNLVWYVVASVSWIRYAFIGLAFASLFVARLFHDLTNGFDLRGMWHGVRERASGWPMRVAPLAALGVLALMIVLPAGRTALSIVREPAPDSFAMADYMNANVAPDALVETWEPQMGFLTDHRYHYPPQLMLNRAVRQVWQGDTPVAELYDFTALSPDYVLAGEFSRWVNAYPFEKIQAQYDYVTTIGQYELFRRK
jgi:hypothetical protein